jgi:hypothetical protein
VRVSPHWPDLPYSYEVSPSDHPYQGTCNCIPSPTTAPRDLPSQVTENKPSFDHLILAITQTGQCFVTERTIRALRFLGTYQITRRDRCTYLSLSYQHRALKLDHGNPCKPSSRGTPRDPQSFGALGFTCRATRMPVSLWLCQGQPGPVP